MSREPNSSDWVVLGMILVKPSLATPDVLETLPRDWSDALASGREAMARLFRTHLSGESESLCNRFYRKCVLNNRRYMLEDIGTKARIHFNNEDALRALGEAIQRALEVSDEIISESD